MTLLRLIDDVIRCIKSDDVRENFQIFYLMNKLLLVAGAALIAATFLVSNQITTPVVSDYVTEFKNFKQTYNKKYASSAEDSFRLAVFTANLMEADLHNANPEATWVMGVTQFSDLT
jgi:Cathepsin propeptide inhibitor domain (I29)